MLPRSPLYNAHNISNSPDRHTVSLSPRVAQRVATQSSPGVLFSQPPRRYRHQTNSFSFDESERSSAAYEQDRVASFSSTGSRPRPSNDVNLHEELHRNSLEEPDIDDVNSNITHSDESQYPHSTDNNETPQRSLPLPPPFSTTPRNVSTAGSLPELNQGKSRKSRNYISLLWSK
jgi:hypothetical protein